MMKLNWRNSFLLFLILTCIIALTGCFKFQDDGVAQDGVNNVENEKTAIPNSKSISKQKQPKRYVGELELPVTGATGYSSVILELKSAPDIESKSIQILQAGTAFVILEEVGSWWLIEYGDFSGWVQHQFCFINLPDVIPSIIYNNTNTYSSEFVSSTKQIPGITGEALYFGKSYNARLGKEEFILPVLYTMSKKLYQAQQLALKEGNTLIIYEGYRPYSVQKSVVNAITMLANRDLKVMAGINTYPWSTNWFIATSLSNHQLGYAIDVSLAKINAKRDKIIGNFSITNITSFEEYTMPTKIHELSMASATFTSPVPSKSPTDWKYATLQNSMNEAAITLQRYCTNSGLTPLASEWWHFNDLNALNDTIGNSSDGSFFITEVYSTTPK